MLDKIFCWVMKSAEKLKWLKSNYTISGTSLLILTAFFRKVWIVLQNSLFVASIGFEAIVLPKNTIFISLKIRLFEEWCWKSSSLFIGNNHSEVSISQKSMESDAPSGSGLFNGGLCNPLMIDEITKQQNSVFLDVHLFVLEWIFNEQRIV